MTEFLGCRVQFLAKNSNTRTRVAHAILRHPAGDIPRGVHAGEKHGYTWAIGNDGVEPARIVSVTMSLDGTSLRSWKVVFHAVFGDARTGELQSGLWKGASAEYESRDHDRSGQDLLSVQAKIFYAAQKRFEMTIC